MGDLISKSALIETIWRTHNATEKECFVCVDDLKDMLCGLAAMVDEQPTIEAVKLPCKPGDIVYMLNIEKGKGRIDAKEVSNIDIEIFSSGNVMIQVWFKTAGFCFGNQFGKVAFLDKLEAGKELIRRTIPE